MQIIIDHRLPDAAKKTLTQFGEVINFETSGITVGPLSGHPDIFLCQTEKTLVVSPDIPEEFKIILKAKNLNYVYGFKKVGMDYPFCAHYNAVVTKKYLIHNLNITDEIILKSAAGLKNINVRQGFTRCSLVMLGEENFITSDHGIFKTLHNQGMQGLLVSAHDVILQGYAHGLFGGACGVSENKLFICGALKHFCDGEKIKCFTESINYQVVELYDGPLIDGGGIFFVG